MGVAVCRWHDLEDCIQHALREAAEHSLIYMLLIFGTSQATCYHDSVECPVLHQHFYYSLETSQCRWVKLVTSPTAECCHRPRFTVISVNYERDSDIQTEF